MRNIENIAKYDNLFNVSVLFYIIYQMNQNDSRHAIVDGIRSIESLERDLANAIAQAGRSLYAAGGSSDGSIAYKRENATASTSSTKHDNSAQNIGVHANVKDEVIESIDLIDEDDDEPPQSNTNQIQLPISDIEVARRRNIATDQKVRPLAKIDSNAGTLAVAAENALTETANVNAMAVSDVAAKVSVPPIGGASSELTNGR